MIDEVIIESSESVAPTNNSKGSGLSPGAVGGIVGGVIGVCVLFALVVALFCCRPKQKIAGENTQKEEALPSARVAGRSFVGSKQELVLDEFKDGVVGARLQYPSYEDGISGRLGSEK